uniref:zinc ribbon domain-containing protein n=1 Tax=Blautia massiliensis (ex Durand et al. 2017) TaxID=1737424 RepID=UPI0022E2C48E
YFASSKICSVCGHKKKELALSDRMYVCECGNRMDRDVNAAVNIREEGKRIYAGSPHFKIVRFKWWEHVTT